MDMMGPPLTILSSSSLGSLRASNVG